MNMPFSLGKYRYTPPRSFSCRPLWRTYPRSKSGGFYSELVLHIETFHHWNTLGITYNQSMFNCKINLLRNIIFQFFTNTIVTAQRKLWTNCGPQPPTPPRCSRRLKNFMHKSFFICWKDTPPLLLKFSRLLWLLEPLCEVESDFNQICYATQPLK